MAKSVTLSGAHIKLYINNDIYPVVQSVTFSVDYGEYPIYGIDAPHAQELGPGKIEVRGNIQGLRTKHSGGLQAANARTLFNHAASSPYVSIRIQDRSTGEDILFVPNAKITRENHSISIKNTYKLNFDFIGQIPLFALDRA